jgi:hypothetical protein
MQEYQIAFRLVKGNSVQQKTIVPASDSFTARRLVGVIAVKPKLENTDLA